MKKILTIIGFAWALACLVIVLATFMGNDSLAKLFASKSGLTVSPWYLGGEVVSTIRHDGYSTRIRKPVFQALIGQRDKGFIQVDWKPDSVLCKFQVKPSDGRPGPRTAAIPGRLDGLLPAVITDTILLGGGKPGIQVVIDPTKASVSVSPLDQKLPPDLFALGPVEWKPDSSLLRVTIESVTLAGGRARNYYSVYWRPDSCLPKTITDTVDYDGSGPDFVVRLDREKEALSLGMRTDKVLGGEKVYKLHHGWAARVNVKRVNSIEEIE